MRQVFTSARLETVEGVAALLESHGIKTWVSNSRSYSGSRRRHFSYRENAKDAPAPAAVWIVHAQDQPRARTLLREAGLIETTRSSYLPEQATAAAPARTPATTAARVRMLLLGIVVLLAFATQARRCQNLQPAQALPEPTPAPETRTEPEPERHIIELNPSRSD